MRFSVLAEFFCGFAVLDDFLFGFAVSNTPQCPPRSLILSCLGLPVSSCLVGSTASFGRTRCDVNVVSDLKTARMPCYCRQRRSCSDRPLT